MKKLITISLALTVLVTPASASASPLLSADNDLSGIFNLNVSLFQRPLQPLTVIEQPAPVELPKAPEKPQHQVYTVVEGDNLTKIGTAHKVEWQRLWAKNKQLKHPDVLQIGDKITIPFPEEKLKRDIPAAVALPVATPGVEAPRRAAPTASYTGGNTYSYGYCTWYVKNKRGASLPNGLGNANTWYSRAAAQGMAVGSTPRAGAVGTTTRGALGHVVYVESVNGDGTITISEMNAPQWGVATTRTASASEFVYIY